MYNFIETASRFVIYLSTFFSKHFKSNKHNKNNKQYKKSKSSDKNKKLMMLLEYKIYILNLKKIIIIKKINNLNIIKSKLEG
jgi:hypothetical protein